jgi:flagellin
MTISIQSSTAALATLEALTPQTGASSGAGAPASLLGQNQSSNSASTIVDLSGGAASAQLGGLSGGLATSASIADAAVAAGSSIQDILSQIRQDAVAASSPSLDDDTRAALNSGFQAGLSQIQAAVAGAGVGGVNLIDGSVSGQLSAQQAPGATLTATNLSLGGPLIGLSAGASLDDPADAAALTDQLGQAIDNVGQAVGQIAAQSQAINSHLAVVAQASASLSGVDPNLDADGARLAALSVQQQLTLTNAPIGNQTPTAILSLFR